MEKENTMTKWGIIQQIQDWINIQKATNITHHNNELKKQNHMTIPVNEEKAMTKFNTHSFKIQKTKQKITPKPPKQKTRYKWYIVNLLKSMDKHPTGNIILGDERLNAVS